MKRRILFIVILLLLSILTKATVYYVNGTTGSDLPGNGTSTNPWKTITYALSQISGSGHTVYVAAGTYNSTLGETFPIVVKSGVSLSGEGEATTIIDAAGSQRVMNCIGITDPSTFIEGFTIKGGYIGSNSAVGGGIFISAGTAMTLRNNTISDNSLGTWGEGVGIYIINSSPKIINNTISLNRVAAWGKGVAIAAYGSSPLIEKNIIVNNTTNSFNSDGCIYLDGSSSSPLILNNVIAKNDGSGILCIAGTPTIINNTISDNLEHGISISTAALPDSVLNNIISYNAGYGIYESGVSNVSLKVWYNLFYSNGSGLYYDDGLTEYFTSSSLNSIVPECKNNIDADPFLTDRANNNYHIKLYSPSIDAGDPNSPYDNEPSPNGSRINLGAYGNTAEATITATPPVLPVDLYVNASTGSDITGDGNSSSPWKTITYSISQITGSNHIIHVAAGTYNTGLGESFPIIIKNSVSLLGDGESTTIIDADGTQRVMTCSGITDPSTYVDGFTITGGSLGGNFQIGGGIYISAGTTMTFRNNTIKENFLGSWGEGGGIYIINSSPAILNNTISLNAVYNSGVGLAIAIYSSSPLIERNLILHNSTTMSTSESCIYVDGSSSTPQIKFNVIARNDGSGIYCNAGAPTIINNTISDNNNDGISLLGTSTPNSVINNIISNNSGYGIYEYGTSNDPGKAWYNLFYSNVSGLYRDEGTTDYFTESSLNSGVPECKNNLGGDPVYIDRTNNNYHIFTNSPAIDTGDPLSPLDPDGSRVDIGAYYFIPPPDPPVALAPTSFTQSGFQANWNASTGATGYYLDVATDAGFTVFVSGFNGMNVLNVITYSVTGLSANTQYYYRIRAYNPTGTSASSNVISIATPQIPAPEAPTALSESNKTQTSFYANWNASATATGYFMDVATDNAFTSFVPGYNNKTLANVVTSQVSGLSPNTTYYYRVRAFNAGGTSPSSNTISLTTLQILPPAAPAVLDASSITQTGFTANWNTSSTATGYILDVAGDAAFTDWIAGAAYANLDVSNVTSYDITGLSPNTNYFYRLTAYNAGGQSSYSIVMPVTTPDYPPAAPVANEATNNGRRNFTANWSSSATAIGYYLDVASNSSFTTFVTGYNNKDILNTLSWNVSDLTPGTTYYYRVRAYNTGGASDNSNTVTTNTLQIPVTDHYVNVSTGDNSTGDGTAAKPWKTITYALERITVMGRHKINVAAGNYNTTSGESFPIMPGDSISLIGSGKNITIIDAGSINTVLKYAGILDPQVTIEGFTITGGKSNVSDNAGGIYISGGSVLTVSDNIITANRAEESASGGAIYVYNSSPTIVKNVISLNHGQIINNGASIFINGSASAPLITENTIMDNINDIMAGGIIGAGTLVISGSSGANVINNVFTNNNPGGEYSNSKDGGDIYIVNCSPTIKYNLITKSKGNGIFVYNTASSPSIINNTISDNTYDGIYLYAAKPDSVFNNIISYNSGYGINEGGSSSDPARVEYNLFYQNSLGLYYDEGNTVLTSVTTLNSTVAECKNNIAGNPLFVDKSNNKYGLTTGSAAIDAGDPGSPLDPNGTRVDIGAYYYILLPAAPVADAASYIGPTDFTANWSSSATATGYYLDVATDNVFTSFVAGYNNRDVLNVTSFNVTGLTENTDYFYRVRAYNSGGTSSNSNTIPVTTSLNPPSAPVCITESSLTQTSFTANWNSSTTATGYYLDVANDNGFTSFIAGYNNRDVFNVTSFNVTGLTANATYYYRVRAYNSAGTSSSSNTISVTTLLNPPSPPSAPVCITESSLTQTSFTANWNSSATATGYYLDIATDNGFTTFVAGYNNRDVLVVTSFNVTGLTANATYYYRVRAYNSGGTSSNSNTISVTTLLNPPSPPSAPVCITESNVTQTSFTANWNSSATATGYYLDVATDNGFTTFVAGYNNRDVLNVTSFNVTGLTANATYYYRVRAYNSGGTSSNSNTISVTTSLNPPSAPVCITESSLTQTSFTANWNSSATATGYYLDIATDNGFTSFIAGYNNRDVFNVTSFNVTGLTANATYYYRVRAYNSAGTSSSSNTISVTTLLNPPSPPSAPVCITESSLTQTSFTANWNSSATATGYYLDVATDNGFITFVAGYNNRDVLVVTSFNVTGLTANATYYYRVRAYNSGGTSSNSNTISVTTLLNPPSPPSAPVCITESNVTQTSFTANWNSSVTATGYYLDVATDNSFNTYVSGYYNKNAGLTTNASVTGLSARSNYFYRVRAYNASGTSGNSNIISVNTLPDPPAAPTGLVASSCNNNVNLTWNAISESDFLRYRIYGGTTSNPTEQIDSTGNQITETTKTINGLTNGETYYFRITAVLSPLVEGDFSSSASVKVKTGVIPKIKVKWNNVLISYNHGDSITGYQWYNGSTAIANATEQYYVTNKLPGSYHVLTIDKNGCRNTSNIITISNTKSLSIFPNPAETSFTLSLVSETIGKAVVSLYNATGIKVLEYQTEKPDRLLSTEIPVGNLQSGTYILELIVNNEEITYSRVVILK